MNRYLADLHIHTAMSPCASPEMTPPAIVRSAIEAGLTMIAICDHNAAANGRPTQLAAAERTGLAVLCGMEITTAEEAHVLGLFPDADAAEAAQREVQASLPDRPAGDESFGQQWSMDESGNVLAKEGKMLSAATKLTLEQTVELVHRLAGLAIASHVDRPVFSVISQLGMIPASAGLDAVEVSGVHAHDDRAKKIDAIGLPAITSSDSHFLSDVGFARTELWMEQPTLAELRLALAGAGGRRWARA